MAVAFDAKPTSDTNFNQGSPLTLSPALTIGASGNGLVAFFTVSATAATVGTLTATWNSVSMTQLGSIAASDGSSICYIFGMIGPTTGSHALTFSWTGGNLQGYADAASFKGVTQTSVAAAFPTANNVTSATTPSGSTFPSSGFAVTTTSGDAVCAGMNCAANQFSTAVTPGVLIFTDGVVNSNGSMLYQLATAATTTAQFSGGASGSPACGIAVRIVQASAAFTFEYFQGLDSVASLANPLSNRFAKRAAIMRGHDGIDAPLILFRPNDWDTHPFQPPHPRPERFAATVGSDQGTEAQFIKFLPNDWDTHPHQPPHPRPEKFAATVGGDQGTQAPFILFRPNDCWDGHLFQPPHPRWEKAGAIMPWEQGIEAQFVPPVSTTITWGWEIAPPPLLARFWPNARAVPDGGDQGIYAPIVFQPYGWEIPAPLTRYRRYTNPEFGDAGIEAQFIVFQPYGWEIAPFQPPHPRPERAGAIMPSEPGIEAQFAFVPTTPVIWGWEVAVPHLKNLTSRGPALYGSADFLSFSFQPYGWEIPPFQPGHPRPERAGAVMAGHQGTDAKFVFVPPTFQPYGWEIAPFQPPHPRPERAASIFGGDQGTEAQFIMFQPYGWEIPPFQPPHPRPERAGAIMLGDTGTEAQFIFVPPNFVAWGWEVAAPHLRQTVLSRYYALEGQSIFAAFTFQPYGWEIAPFQPPHPRAERSGAIPTGHQGTDAQFVFVPPAFTILGWDIPPFQPPHPRPERAGAWMVGHQGTDAPVIFKPYGWEIPPFQPPHPIPERRAAAIMRGDDGIQATLIIPFQEGWHIPPFQPPHPRPERAGAIMIGHPGIDGIFVFVPPPTPTETDWIDFYRRGRRR